MNRDETVALFLQGREAWNAWAEKMLVERKAMEADGRWSQTVKEWTEQARADFSRCLFLVRGPEGTKEAAGETKEKDVLTAPPVKSISLDAGLIDFEGFVFPNDADF